MPAHFINTPEPPKVKGDIRALCGRLIEDAACVEAPIDKEVFEATKLQIDPLRDCKKCVLKGFPERYVSRIVPKAALKSWQRGDDFETL